MALIGLLSTNVVSILVVHMRSAPTVLASSAPVTVRTITLMASTSMGLLPGVRTALLCLSVEQM